MPEERKLTLSRRLLVPRSRSGWMRCVFVASATFAIGYRNYQGGHQYHSHLPVYMDWLWLPVLGSLVWVTVALLGATQVTEKWHLFISIGLLLGTAAGMITLAVASRWFVKGRGLAMGLLTAAFAAGQLTFLPLAAWLPTEHGWRMAVLPAIIGAAVSAALYLMLGRDWPADIGMAPHGTALGHHLFCG